MITRRKILKGLAGLLAFWLTPAPLAGLVPPRTSDNAATDDGTGPATYPNSGQGILINANQVFYPGWRKVVFNSKDYGVIAIDSSTKPSRNIMRRRLRDI